MTKETTFAYMVFSCPSYPPMADEFSDYYWGDFVECSLSFEEQAQEPAAVWAYDLDHGLSRIAPVQLTLGWDPRPVLLQVFARAGIQPHFKNPKKGEANWLAFAPPTEPLLWHEYIQHNILRLVDFERFQQVVNMTLELASEQNGCLLFIGGEGFDYEVNAAHLRDAVPVLQRTTMKFFDRHG